MKKILCIMLALICVMAAVIPSAFASDSVKTFSDFSYNAETVNEQLLALAEKYERKAIIDIDFCGDPELMVFDDDGYCKMYFQKNGKLLPIEISGVQNNKLYFGETDRKLYHLKGKDGRQFFLFNVFRNDEKYPAQMYALEPSYILKEDSDEIFRCVKVGEQKLHIYGEEDGKVHFDYEQAAGEYYSYEYATCTREELYNVLRSKMQELTEQYVSDFELMGEYDLDPLFSSEPVSIFLGTFSEEIVKYMPVYAERITVGGRNYYINDNIVTLCLGKADENIDFDSLSKLKNLSVLEISAENVMSLKGIEKLTNLRSLTLKTGIEGGFSDLDYLSRTKLQSLCLYGEFEDISFISDCTALECIQFFPDSTKSDEYYNPVTAAKGLQLIVLGVSSRDGTLNFTEDNAEYFSENTDANICKFQWDKALERSAAADVDISGYTFELPWEKNTIEYPENMKIKIGGVDILHEGKVEGVSYKNEILILDNAVISTDTVAGISTEGFDDLDIQLIGNNSIEAKYSAFKGSEYITLSGSGSLTVKRLALNSEKNEFVSVNLTENVKFFNENVDDNVMEFKDISIRDNAIMETDKLFCSSVTIEDNGMLNVDSCRVTSISIFGSAQMNVTDSTSEKDSAAIRCISKLSMSDDARLTVTTKRNGIGFLLTDAYAELEGNAVVEINGEEDCIGIDHGTFIYGQFIMNGNSKLIINGMGCGIRTVKFIINGGTFYCDPAENGYPVLVKTKGASFLLEGNITEESCSDRIMEYIEEEECYAICSEGKPVGKYSVMVAEK
ncbi:MAG: hypothetical protein ACI4YB_00330 [Oscillospiraceae bacterium]